MIFNKKDFESKIVCAMTPFFNELLKGENVQTRIANEVDSETDLNDEVERINMAQCMAKDAPLYIAEYFSDVFLDIYADQLVIKGVNNG